VGEAFSKRQGFIFVNGKKIWFEVPQEWEIICQSAPQMAWVTQVSVEERLMRSLESPIASPRIRDLARPDSRVAILVDDDTRPTPVKDLLPVVLRELHDCGVDDGNTDIVIAVGTHPPLVGERLERRLGRRIPEDYRVTNHDSWADDLVCIGTIGDVEVQVNPIVAQADLKIGIGANLPHPFAGFGGGPKIAMPGICGYDTIREHHTSTLMQPGSYLGRIDGNPFYDFICQTSELLGLDYVIDCVVDAEGQPVQTVSGHPIKAHEAGIAACRQIYGVEIPEEADVTISSAYPHEGSPQIIKPILPAVMSTKQDGILILVAVCQDALPEPFLEMFDLVRSLHPHDPMQTVLEHMRGRKAFVPNSPMDFNCAIQVNFGCLRHINVILVSENLRETQASRMGFRHAPDLETAIDIAYHLRPGAKVNVFASGGVVLPLVGKEIDLFAS